jgi:hypothetical protein
MNGTPHLLCTVHKSVREHVQAPASLRGGQEEGEESVTGTARQLVGEEISAPPKIDIESIELAAFIESSTCLFFTRIKVSTCCVAHTFLIEYTESGTEW